MSKLTLNFENDEQRDEFVGWFSDGGGENDYWNFYECRSNPCPATNLIFNTEGLVNEMNFKVIEEEE